jgi:hypothetical protein
MAHLIANLIAFLSLLIGGGVAGAAKVYDVTPRVLLIF